MIMGGGEHRVYLLCLFDQKPDILVIANTGGKEGNCFDDISSIFEALYNPLCQT